MRKIIVLMVMIGSLTFSYAQTIDNKLNLGLHFGTQEYNGDFENEFFTGKQNIAFGVSLSKYVSPWFDVMGMITYSKLDNGDTTSSFETAFLDFKIMAKLKFNNGKWLKQTSRVQPYFIFGFGDGVSKADHYIRNSQNISVDVNLFAGLGINFEVSETFGISLMSTYTYIWNDDFDDRKSSVNKFQDQLLMTTLGINYSFNRKKKSE